jgi:formate dehydrogenase iron-sulfur subunit
MAAGQAPACAAVCPTGATIFGDRDRLVQDARARLTATPKSYVPHVYGLEEVGGTSVLMLSSVPFPSLGLRTDLPLQPLPMLTWQALSKVPDVVIVGGVLLYGIWWITNRRIEAQERSTQQAVQPK